jgi:hypothetical protein
MMLEQMRIVLANEPRSYREVIAAAFQVLRPHHEVFVVAPDELDHEVTRLAPHMVVCSRVSSAVRTIALAWILLYPGGTSHAEVFEDGTHTTLPEVDFNSLISIMDRTEQLAENG